MGKEITVYVLTYNRPTYLRECLASLRAQTFRNFKTIVLDNCSSQSLDSILQEFSDLKVDYVRHEKNLGSTGNFSFAWNLKKTTEYFVIFHDDDLMLPDFLQLESNFLDTHQSVVWVACNSRSFKGRRPELPKRYCGNSIILSGPELALGLIENKLAITFSSVMYRSNLVRQANLPLLIQRNAILFDRPLLFELTSENPCALISEQLILYRVHDNQDSKNGSIHEDNILELIYSYKKQLRFERPEIIRKSFNNWSSFHLLSGYIKLGRNQKTTFAAYLEKAKIKGIYNRKILCLYLLGLLRIWCDLSIRRAKLLVTEPRTFAAAFYRRLLQRN